MPRDQYPKKIVYIYDTYESHIEGDDVKCYIENQDNAYAFLALRNMNPYDKPDSVHNWIKTETDGQRTKETN